MTQFARDVSGVGRSSPVGVQQHPIELECSEFDDGPLELVFEEQSGWLWSQIVCTGWVGSLSAKQRQVLLTAIVGFYRLAGVDLVREQIAASFAPRDIPYDVDEEGLLIWPDGQFRDEAVYNLRHHLTVRPWPRAVVRTHDLPSLPVEHLIFSRTSLAWSDWSQQWDNSSDDDRPDVLPTDISWDWRLSSTRSDNAPQHS